MILSTAGASVTAALRKSTHGVKLGFVVFQWFAMGCCVACAVGVCDVGECVFEILRDRSAEFGGIAVAPRANKQT